MYGEPTMSLGDQRYNAYREQIMKGTLRPERWPQSSGVAVQHGRRMFTQLCSNFDHVIFRHIGFLELSFSTG